MHIEYIAYWTHQLETLTIFDETSTGAQAHQKYSNLKKYFESYWFTMEAHPRITGDRYDESVVLKPHGNRIEITV